MSSDSNIPTVFSFLRMANLTKISYFLSLFLSLSSAKQQRPTKPAAATSSSSSPRPGQNSPPEQVKEKCVQKEKAWNSSQLLCAAAVTAAAAAAAATTSPLTVAFFVHFCFLCSRTSCHRPKLLICFISLRFCHIAWSPFFLFSSYYMVVCFLNYFLCCTLYSCLNFVTKHFWLWNSQDSRWRKVLLSFWWSDIPQSQNPHSPQVDARWLKHVFKSFLFYESEICVSFCAVVVVVWLNVQEC